MKDLPLDIQPPSSC